MISSLASGSRVIALDEEFVFGTDFPASRAWRHQFTLKHIITMLRTFAVITRTSKKKPTCELFDCQPLQTGTTETKGKQ
jgi:hypothetical protein